MAATISMLNPDNPRRILIIASNPTISQQTGWPIGAWAAEVIHPYWEFTEKGYHVTIASPDGGKVALDTWSDPRDDSQYSEHDLLSRGFLESPRHAALLERTPSLADIDPATFDAIVLAGGQGPMYTFFNNQQLYAVVRDSYEAGKVVGVVCHATCVLLNLTLSDGTLLVDGKTWTGFADSEEAYADAFVGRRIQPFWIEEEARKLPTTNYIRGPRFAPFAHRDGRLVTGQQQYSAGAAAKLIIEALGV